MGDFAREKVDALVFKKLFDSLKPRGALVLCFNSNAGFMEGLLAFAKSRLKQMRYDYFDDSILSDVSSASIKKVSFVTPMEYESFDELGRACWMLFATAFDDIGETAKIFIPYLRKKLKKPSFNLEQTLLILEKP